MKDNKLLQWFAGAAFSVLFVAGLVATSTMTLGVMDIVIPRVPVIKWLALAFFDGGALTWWMVYILKAKGTPQRGISLLTFGIDLLGVLLMVIGMIYLGGQVIADIPSWLGRALVNGTIAVMIGNLVAAYYYHASHPEVIESIQAQVLEDRLAEEALAQARRNIEREALNLGAILARRSTARIKYRLALPMSESERAEWDGETVDAKAEDMPALPAPAALKPSLHALFWTWLKSFFTRGQQPKPSEPITSTASNDSSSNDESPAEDPKPQA